MNSNQRQSVRKPKLLRYEVRLGVHAGLPGTDHRAAVAIRVVLELTASEPAELIKAGLQLEANAHAAKVIEIVGNINHVMMDLTPISKYIDAMGVLDKRFGRLRSRCHAPAMT